MSADATKIDDRSTVETGQMGTGKARLLNFSDLDKRTRAVQQALALRDELIRERGGREALNATCLMMLEDIAIISSMIRSLQIEWLRGADISLSEMCTLVNVRRRILENPEIGLPLTPSVSCNGAADTRQLARAVMELFEEAAMLERADTTDGDR